MRLVLLLLASCILVGTSACQSSAAGDKGAWKTGKEADGMTKKPCKT